MADLRIVGGTVLTMDPDQRVLQGAEVGVAGGRIEYLGPQRDMVPGEVVDASGCVVMPGLVNAHTHAAMTLMRSYADDMPLQAWLETRIWPLEAHLTADDVYWGTQLGAVEMLRAGVTCFQDMYWHAEAATRGGLEAGMRVCPSGVLIGVHPSAEGMFGEAVEFVDRCLAEDHPRCHIRFGPHAPYTVPDAYLERVIAAAAERDVPVHIHLSETLHEVEGSLAQHGERPVVHMQRVGLFDVACCAAHCVHLDADEVGILAERRVGVLASHTSNLKLGAGVMPLPDLHAAGAVIGLGTDGPASNNNLDVLEEARLAALIHKGVRHDPTTITAAEALAMATWGGAEAVGIPQLGRLIEGWRADLICLDL
ncbi:MAG: amidohydrolase, partial [Armatimonadetes bacterium]|nr:amidohydrolase [Armatimonadota bacterium]